MSESRPLLPLMLTEPTRRALVIGGGPAAFRKTRTLLDAGWKPDLIALAWSGELAALCEQEGLRRETRAFREGDTSGYTLVVSATGDRVVTEGISAEIRARGGLIVCADYPELGNAILPAVERAGGVTVAVSTGGGAPVLAAHIRDRLRPMLDDGSVTAAIRTLGALRESWRTAGLPPGDLAACERRLIRREALGALEGPGGADLVEHARKLAEGPGPVILVGAGPGNTGLATLAAARALSRADVVLYDLLVNERLLNYAPADATREFVGKKAGGQYTAQDEINRRLDEHARRGATVVRLKGGDPFLFGRGSEEWRYLTERGIAVECVNGVSSAFAALTAAGLPLTERERCDSVFVTTGHRSVSPGTRLIPDYDPGLLVIVLMSSKSLAEVIAAFEPRGWLATTPAVLISRATLPDQRQRFCRLADALETAHARPLPTPALLAVGEVIGHPVTAVVPPDARD